MFLYNVKKHARYIKTRISTKAGFPNTLLNGKVYVKQRIPFIRSLFFTLLVKK